MKNNKNTKLKPKPVKNGKRVWWLLIIAIGLIAMGVLLFHNWRANQGPQQTIATVSPASEPARSSTDLLVGRWVRTDSNGGYTLEISGASPDGLLNAKYFNPNPINVAKANWHKKDGALIVSVELRDVNYPGSTYTLKLLPSENRLTGNYYQAMEGTNFEVDFALVK